MLNDVHICHVIKVTGDKRETVFTFIGGTDFAGAQFLAGAAADTWTDSTGDQVDWFVEPLPYAGGCSAEYLLVEAVRTAAGEEMDKRSAAGLERQREGLETAKRVLADPSGHKVETLAMAAALVAALETPA